MIGGALLFNDDENPDRSIVALDDRHLQVGVGFLVTCDGHAPQMGNSDHFHASPRRGTKTVDGTGTHSAMIDVLLDGFPIYGPQGGAGVIVTNADPDALSAQRPSDLDVVAAVLWTSADALLPPPG